jgi:hypothetical protein
MLKTQAETSVRSPFELKTVCVELMPAGRSSPSPFIAVEELEAMRAEGRAVSASKHGLERICGASCEVGAQ